jgi:conjugative relaxase-like TrwC/TraI family protein
LPRGETPLTAKGICITETRVLSIVKLRDAEYVLRQIAKGIDEYYTSSKEPPGVWQGRWAAELGLEGVVEADHLRALIQGADPVSGTELLAGNPPRKVNAFDATFSAPKSVSLLQALGTPEVASAISICHTEALSVALGVLDRRAAFTRRQVDGVRKAASTGGLAVATFVHHTSRAADPQLHSHCVIPNLVRREDLRFVSLDATHLYDWAKAAGSIYQEDLRRRLSGSLGVAWGEDRNGCREMLGFTGEQLRAFSKRTSEIEAWLEANGSAAETPAEKRAMNDTAALATRAAKDPNLNPEVLEARWRTEAKEVGLSTGEALVDRVCNMSRAPLAPSKEIVYAHLLDNEKGLCARDSRFGEAQVTAAIAAVGVGAFNLDRIETLTREFLTSEHVVRLAPPPQIAGTRPAQFSLASHRRREDFVLERLDTLDRQMDEGVSVQDACDRLRTLDLGEDQRRAVCALCEPGPALRALVSPAGHGKTTTLAAAAELMRSAGRPVIGLSTTHQAVGELRRAGIEALTIASLLRGHRLIAPRTVFVLDEMSQCSTKDAAALLQLVGSIPGVMLWCSGDSAQAQSVAAGGVAHEIEQMAAEGTCPAPCLVVNRRQLDPTEREALVFYRRGEIEASQHVRDGGGLEHELADSTATKLAMAEACARDVIDHGPKGVVGLCTTHAEAEELADVIRAKLKEASVLEGPAMSGPGWTTERHYCAGDRILLHATTRSAGADLHNGDVVTATAVTGRGIFVRADRGQNLFLDHGFVSGRRDDRLPNVSHAWARTIEGAQGGTWDNVHLLASPRLDRERGYVGLSRGRLSTHAWYVRPSIEVDHGGHLAITPTAREAVGETFGREGAQRFAAADDPYRKERLLREARQRHLESLAGRGVDQPPTDAGGHRACLVQIDHEVADLWAEAVLSAVRQGNPFAFGKQKLLEARRHVERTLDEQEGCRAQGRGVTVEGGSINREPVAHRWSAKDLAELEFLNRTPATWSPMDRVLDPRRRPSYGSDRQRNRTGRTAGSRGHGRGR